MDIVKVRSAILIFVFISAGFVLGGKVLACGDPPGQGCPPCHYLDAAGHCKYKCKCACLECDESTGDCYEDCDYSVEWRCCCAPAPDNSGECCRHGEGCCSGGYCCKTGEECCDGTCCDANNCETCVEGVCVDRCEYYWSDWCLICDGAGNCISRCNPDLCESCDWDGNCEVCGGDPDMTCCDGSCVDKCDIVDGESCEDEYPPERPCGLTCVAGECMQDSTTVYSNFTEKICNPEGCPGDCIHNTHWCWKEFDCVPGELVLDWHACTNIVEGPGGWPMPMPYYYCDFTLLPWDECRYCTESQPTYTHYVDNDSCN